MTQAVRLCVCGVALTGVTSGEREREGEMRKGQSESERGGCGGCCVALKEPSVWEGSRIVNTLVILSKKDRPASV